MPKTVGVAVSNATFHFDKLYTYAVLPEHQNAVRLGSMVLVPFGKGSRARMGVVLARRCPGLRPAASSCSAQRRWRWNTAPDSRACRSRRRRSREG